MAERRFDRPPHGAQLLVQARDQDPLQRAVDRTRRRHQAQEDQRQRGGQDTGPDRKHRYCASLSEYPAPRTVWIRGGPTRSTFLRR